MRVEDPPIVLPPLRSARTDRRVLSIARVLCLAIALPLGTGCEAPVETTRPVVRDSAGVRIVEHAAVATENPPVIASPAWTHGLEDGEYLFQGPLVGDLLPGGGVAIGDLGRDEIVVLSPGGERLAVLGGPGEGPGEVGGIRTVTALTDGGVVVRRTASGRRSRPGSASGAHPGNTIDRWKRGADEPLPLYDGFIMANKGDVWLEPFPVETDLADRFTVLSHDGERWTRVHLPGPVRVLAASHDRVLGVARDALDVQYVVVYEFDGGTWNDRTDEETP